jgi:hypothetical protein
MELPEEVVEDLRKRLRRVAGQVQGVDGCWPKAESAGMWLLS